jgi:hypothetical protein
MLPGARFSTGAAHGVARASCPRCRSADVRRLSLIHRLGSSPSHAGPATVMSALSHYAAPPRKKPAAQWTLLALVSIGTLVVALASARHGTTILALIAGLVATLAGRAAHYNARVYPRLHELWARSFMCARCGEVFALTEG